MVPPADIFGVIPTWAGVYAALIIALALAGYAIYHRVFRLILQGKAAARFDRPWERLRGALVIVLGQRKVLQRVGHTDPRSRSVDLAGLGHASIFWGFLSFSLSYLIFIFGNAIWHPFAETLLTPTGVQVYSAYLDHPGRGRPGSVNLGVGAPLAGHAPPPQLRPDPKGGVNNRGRPDRGPDGGHPAGPLLLRGWWGRWSRGTNFRRRGHRAVVHQPGHERRRRQRVAGGLLVGAPGYHPGFAIYIPFSKHIHMVAAPLNAFFRSLEPRGALESIDLENAERFGAGRVQDFTWKQLLDGYACAVCGRCTDACPANITGKVSPRCTSSRT